MSDDRRERILALRAQGLNWNRVARELGIPYTTCRRLADPAYAERQRVVSLEAKRRRTGRCENCGATTRYGGKGANGVSRRCMPCARESEAARQHKRIGTGPTQRRLLALLRQHGEMRWREIAEAMGWTAGSAAGHLHHYCALGIVKRIGRGRYAVAE